MSTLKNMCNFREGHLCDDCVPLPGCEHGSCTNAFECNCDTDKNGTRPMWEGAFCDKREWIIVKISPLFHK